MDMDKTKDEIPTKGRKRKCSELELSGNISEEFPVNVEPGGEDVLGKLSNATAILSTTHDIVKTSIEQDVDSIAGTSKDVPDGLIKDNGCITDAAENSGSITGSPSLISGKATLASTLSSPAITSRKKKPKVDLSNLNYLKPFQYGWKREQVFRATLASNLGKRNSDIYYHTPSGRKVRSMREVYEHLENSDLTLENFTFTKQPLGLDDPEKEIIRKAGIKPTTPLAKKLKIPSGRAKEAKERNAQMLTEMEHRTLQSTATAISDRIQQNRNADAIEISDVDMPDSSTQPIFSVTSSDAGSDISVEFVDTYVLEVNDGADNIPSTSRDQHHKLRVDKVLHTSEHAKKNHELHTEESLVDSPKVEEKGMSDCAVCLESLNKGKEVSSTTCGHIFCTSCIEKVIKLYGRCPICQTHLNSKKVHSIFLF